MQITRRMALGAGAAMLLGAARARGADSLRVLLDWFVDANHAALFAAHYSGAFARQGLAVELIPPADPNTPPRMVVAGQADLAVSYQAQLQIFAAKGVPLTRIATLIARPLNTLLALGDGPVRQLADLRGRRVGISIGGADEAVLGGMLASVGLKLSDVRTIPLTFDLEAALLSRQLDAMMGGMRNYEQVDLALRGAAPRAFDPEAHGVPPWDELVLVARRDRAGDPRLHRFNLALAEGTRALRADPEKIRLAMEADHAELRTPLNRAAWIATLPLLADDPLALDRARYERFAAFLLQQGAIGRTVAVTQYTATP